MEQRACVEYMKSCYNENDLFKIFIMVSQNLTTACILVLEIMK